MKSPSKNPRFPESSRLHPSGFHKTVSSRPMFTPIPDTSTDVALENCAAVKSNVIYSPSPGFRIPRPFKSSINPLLRVPASREHANLTSQFPSSKTAGPRTNLTSSQFPSSTREGPRASLTYTQAPLPRGADHAPAWWGVFPENLVTESTTAARINDGEPLVPNIIHACDDYARNIRTGKPTTITGSQYFYDPNGTHHKCHYVYHDFRGCPKSC